MILKSKRFTGEGVVKCMEFSSTLFICYSPCLFLIRLGYYVENKYILTKEMEASQSVCSNGSQLQELTALLTLQVRA